MDKKFTLICLPDEKAGETLEELRNKIASGGFASPRRATDDY